MEINATQHLGRLRLYSTRLQNGGFDLGSWVGTGTVCEDVRSVSDFQGGFSLFFLLLFHDNNYSDSTHFEDSCCGCLLSNAHKNEQNITTVKQDHTTMYIL